MRAALANLSPRRDAAWQALKFHGLHLRRFANRYGAALAALALAAVLGWAIASGVSDYTQHGWELHVRQPTLGVDIHFHHWYYGIPLGLLALALVERAATFSIFLFGLGLSLSTHSFVNEGGIPSIFEGGETWRVPVEVYLPLVTLYALLYTFFIIRREEWLARSREREELAMSYICLSRDAGEVLARVNRWARAHFSKPHLHHDRWTKIEYGQWREIDEETHGEWQFHYTLSPFDEAHHLLVISLQHIPLIGRKGVLDEWLVDIHRQLQPLAQLALNEDGGAPILQVETEGNHAAPV